MWLGFLFLMTKLSVIVPTWNEEKNVAPLVEQIHAVLNAQKITYEIIFVDDHSTDKTTAIIKKMAAKYPLQLFLKEGKQGKAYSLLEGFTHAKYSLLCMIDADLQYPPEAIPEMIKKIKSGADIVVANRQKYSAGVARKIMSTIFHSIFARFLHGFTVDVQSGLKVFKKTVIEHIEVNPSSWTFDMEFLLKSRHAGYSIDGIPIHFEKRHAGNSKIAVLKSSVEIALSAIDLKVNDSGIIPFSKQQEETHGEGFHARGNSYVHHTKLHLRESAYARMTPYQYLALFCLADFLIVGLVIDWHATLVFVISVLTIIYFADLLFNLFLIYQSYFRKGEINFNKKQIEKMKDTDWPIYTILCPLYKEWDVLPQFIDSMSKLDYPKDKLQVMLLLESDDTESIAKIQMMDLPEYFEMVVVPDSLPKTKPKACNYGLTKARGEYTVIYDAEDIPEPLQLKKAILAFKKGAKDIVCIQARLNFYNPTQNILTRLFTIEYSLWFNLVLTGLQSINAPIPLGGTSNHFRTKDLLHLNKWDPFNVTEDADLGIRLMKRGYRTALLDSYTMEEANSRPLSWIRQRSRWIKGYIQTYYVHMRDPKTFFTGGNIHNFLAFQLIIGAKIFSLTVNPLMWTMTIAYFVFKPFTGHFIESLFLTPIFYMAIVSMFIGNFLYMYYYMLGAAKRDEWELVPFALLTPIYWLAMSAAALMAGWEFIFKPHYWHKTQHGLHLNTDDDDYQGFDGEPQIATLSA